MKTFKVNDYITLKLEGKNTTIYVGGERFKQCKYLLLNIPADKVDTFDEIESIDEAAKNLDGSLEPIANLDEDVYSIDISPEVGYWAHCSNLQTWDENNYNTNLLHSNLSFPLLKRLVQSGDKKARKSFKEEIAKRLESGYLPTIRYLWNEGFIKYLSSEELSALPNFKYRELSYILEIESLVNIKFFWLVDRDEAIENRIWFSVSKGYITELQIASVDNLNFFPEPITELRHLTDLRLIETSIESIRGTIGNLEYLKHLDMSGNKISKIPNTIGNCINLDFLGFGGNMITTLPDSIGNLKSLKKFELYDNFLSGLPQTIGNLVSLNSLNIGNNKIETLPISFQNLQSLESLNLRNNKLTKISEAIGNLKSLKYLLIHGNKLENNSITSKNLLNFDGLKSLQVDEIQYHQFKETIKRLEIKNILINIVKA